MPERLPGVGGYQAPFTAESATKSEDTGQTAFIDESSIDINLI